MEPWLRVRRSPDTVKILTVRSGLNMDPVGLDSVKTALFAQDQKIQLHEIQLTNISSGIKELTDSHTELKTGVDTQVRHLEEHTTSRAEPTVSPAAVRLTTPTAQQSESSRPVRLAPPEKFSGDSAWEASRALLRLKQGNRRVVDYAMEFRTMAADSSWNSAAIKGTFVSGFNDCIKDQLAPHEPPEEFEDLVDLATRIDVRLQERDPGHRFFAPPGALGGFREFRPSSNLSRAEKDRAPPTHPEEPMHLGHTGLTPEERLRRRRKEGACFYCG
ncbi:hypothetical protein L3Q82_006644 [Scortum barcoo]|uniref:Uncharacterized protein n=1 Tax=Scortum barcoo TaxID=214431 RepID=A0ACB8X0Q0_9TELE|nr:hypothetical protein L3Q82_006644 [Scortum barcoo]